MVQRVLQFVRSWFVSKKKNCIFIRDRIFRSIFCNFFRIGKKFWREVKFWVRTKQSKKKQRKSGEEETRDSLFEQSIILAWKSRTSLHPDLSVMIRPMLPLYKTLYSSVVTVRRSSRNPRSPTTQYQPRVGIWKARRGLWKKVLRKTPCCPSFLKQAAAKRVQVQATDAMRRTQHSGGGGNTQSTSSFQSQKFAWWLIYWTGRHQILFFGKLRFSHKCVQEEQSSK